MMTEVIHGQGQAQFDIKDKISFVQGEHRQKTTKVENKTMERKFNYKTKIQFKMA